VVLISCSIFILHYDLLRQYYNFYFKFCIISRGRNLLLELCIGVADVSRDVLTVLVEGSCAVVTVSLWLEFSVIECDVV
jgi:hypothetical protein